MARVVMTFETLHKVLSAERALRAAEGRSFKCRPTPTPPGLSASICGMSIELLEQARVQEIVDFLSEREMTPSGVHTVD